MLDLNLEAIPRDSPPSPGGMNPRLRSLEEDSGTSNSSVVNAEEATAADDGGSSNSGSSLLAFDVVSKRDEARDEIVVRQFFPVDAGGGGGGEDGSSRKAASARMQWLNLSFGDSMGEGIRQHQQQLRQPPPHQPARKSRRGPRSRSSQYRGVTFYRRTGRWESHIWDCGKQVYLGGFDTDYAAARAYDQAAVKFRGVEADINFSVSDYEEDVTEMANLTKEEFVHILRRQSTRFSREASKHGAVNLQKCDQFSGKLPYGYEKTILEFSGREAAATKFKSSLFDSEIVFSARHRGTVQNLDLSLGMISNPSCSKGVESKKENFCRLDRKEPALHREASMVGSPSYLPKGGGIASFASPLKRPPMWPSMYPTVSSSYAVIRQSESPNASDEQSIEDPRFPTYRWQVHGNNTAGTAPTPYPLPLFASNNHNTAASSGFSSSTAKPPAFLAAHNSLHSSAEKNRCPRG